MRRPEFAAVALLVVLAGSLATLGCGDDDGGGGARFTGDVASVTSPTVRAPARAPAFFALEWPRRAFAQSGACDPPSGENLLFCVDEDCTIVDPDECDFEIVVGIGDGPDSRELAFVDDDDGDGDFDDDEDASIVAHALQFCDGDVISVENAAINFTTNTTAATVTKETNGCATAPTPTSGGATRTPTIAVPTPTSTPPYGASLHDPGSAPLVLVAAIGLGGLFVPRRRRR